MADYPFYIVDVFTEKKYCGNQLAVFPAAQGISDSEMQLIAREMNYSETTFILSDTAVDGGYPVRIFTPAEEVPFAGHPTLGTAYIIQQKFFKRPVEKLNLNLRVGQIPVTFEYSGGACSRVWMKQITPTFGATFDGKQMAAILNLEEEDFDPRFPVQEVSTGLPFIIAPLKNLQAVKNSRIDHVKFFELIKNIPPKAILVFSPQTYSPENQLNARVYVDYFGIPEDPATGSANGCLAGYLVQHRYFGKEQIDIRVEQGYEIHRPSLLFLKARRTEQGIEIHVGGKVILVAEAKLL